MTLKHYTRVMPRDAFNEGNLLKCLGRLFLLCEDAATDYTFVHVYTDRPFTIVQDDDDGSITAFNVFMTHKQHPGLKYLFRRPLNSRQPWPLYVWNDDTNLNVFDDNGDLTPEFKELIGYGTKHEVE